MPSSALSLTASPTNSASLALETSINGTIYVPAFNGTYIDQNNCRTDICSLTYAQLFYIPSFGGNLTYLIIFSVLLVCQVLLLGRYRIWGFSLGLLGGLILEVVGYAGRLGLNSNDFDFNDFVMLVSQPRAFLRMLLPSMY